MKESLRLDSGKLLVAVTTQRIRRWFPLGPELLTTAQFPKKNSESQLMVPALPQRASLRPGKQPSTNAGKRLARMCNHADGPIGAPTVGHLKKSKNAKKPMVFLMPRGRLFLA
jgi:hypothetical protein